MTLVVRVLGLLCLAVGIVALYMLFSSDPFPPINLALPCGVCAGVTSGVGISNLTGERW
jgi:hypothetical protein